MPKTIYFTVRPLLHRVLFLFALVAFFAGSVVNVSSQETEKKQAIIPFDSPDPTVIEEKDGSGFYAFTTAPGINVWHSKDLLTWERSKRVFERRVPQWAQERVPGSRGIWAPDIVYFNDLYHLYYSVSTFGGQRSVIGLAVNKTLNPDSPDYRWEDRGLVLESGPDQTDYNAIDSAVFIDEDGKTYLTWGSYWTGLKGVEIDPKTGKPFAYQEDRKDDLKVPANYVHIAARKRQSRTTAVEAPFLVKKDKYYYLFVSWDSCCDFEKSTYKIAVARSEKPLGPFLDKDGVDMALGGGSLLLESTERWRGTGHNGFLRTKNGDWLILAAYDAKEPRKGRLTQVRPLYWNENQWPETGPILEQPYDEFDFSKAPGNPREE